VAFFALLAALALGALVSIGPAAASADAAVSHDLLRGPGEKSETLESWSPVRIGAARPAPAPELETESVGPADPAGPRGAIAPEQPASEAGPARLAARRGAGAYEVHDPASPPNTATGLILYRGRNGLWGCSGTTVTSRTESLLFTAGHCAHSIRDGWARDLVFIPSYREGETPYGVWAAKELWVPGAWYRREHLAYDFAVAVIAPLRGVTLQDAVGSFGLAWNQPRAQSYRAFGYPSNHFGGNRMMGCLSPFARSGPYLGRGPRQVGIHCDFGKGASGGGWLIEDRFLNSVVSGSYRGQPNLLYGPYFGRAAHRLHGRADRG
jgi:V8-like Glu-specific endopeptidase